MSKFILILMIFSQGTPTIKELGVYPDEINCKIAQQRLQLNSQFFHGVLSDMPVGTTCVPHGE